MDPFIQYAVATAEQAMRQSGLTFDERRSRPLVGVIVGVGIGGLLTIEEVHKNFLDTGLRRVTPFFIPKLISNLAPGNIAIRYGAKGINLATTSACASGSHAIGEAYRMIRQGYPQRRDHRRDRGRADLAGTGRIRRDARAFHPQ